MKRILFVDDDLNVLNGLKRMLRSIRNEWKMEFVQSGKEALALLEVEQYDVVISDMRMPGMDGAQLLTQVMEKYPQIVRIILSGYSEKGLILKSVQPTHQFLSKPCDTQKLKNIVYRACNLHDMLYNEKIKIITSRMDSLPSLPGLYQELLNKLKNPDISIKEVASVIQKDLGMTAKILKLVNSSYFGFYKNISNSAQAVTLLGLDTIKTLVLSMEVFSIFKFDKNDEFSFSELWEHSTLTGILAKRIAKEVSDSRHFIEDAFLIGFLHDVGMLILATKLSAEYFNILKNAREENRPLWVAERDKIGSSHAEIGAYLLGLWGFGDHIVEAIAQHHSPVVQKDDPLSLVTILHFTDCFAHKIKKSNQGLILAELDENYLKQLNLLQEGKKWIKICQDVYESGVKS